jgi:hypothetical protein
LPLKLGLHVDKFAVVCDELDTLARSIRPQPPPERLLAKRHEAKVLVVCGKGPVEIGIELLHNRLERGGLVDRFLADARLGNARF